MVSSGDTNSTLPEDPEDPEDPEAPERPGTLSGWDLSTQLGPLVKSGSGALIDLMGLVASHNHARPISARTR